MKQADKIGILTVGTGVLLFGLGVAADAGIITLEIGIPLNALGLFTILGGLGILGAQVGKL